VNAISPGWIHTRGDDLLEADHMQHPAGRVGTPEDVARAALFLCDPRNGFITGQNLVVDGGMTRLMVYHDDHGWEYTLGGLSRHAAAAPQ
jgi:NAD(P)-dependent dehydrogenase (short-subunit alcohol dehydrogenase family)